MNRKRVQRVMRLLGIEAVGPKPRSSQPHPGHRVSPYLLGEVAIERVDQVWSCDITYIRLRSGFVYLMAVLDWFSRCVLAWELSVTLDGPFCRDALEAALATGRPEIFTTDHGAQFTSDAFTARCPRPAPGWGTPSRSTITSDRTRRWRVGRRRRCTARFLPWCSPAHRQDADGHGRGHVEISQTRFPHAHTLLHLNKTETTVTSSTPYAVQTTGSTSLPPTMPLPQNPGCSPVTMISK